MTASRGLDTTIVIFCPEVKDKGENHFYTDLKVVIETTSKETTCVPKLVYVQKEKSCLKDHREFKNHEQFQLE